MENEFYKINTVVSVSKFEGLTIQKIWKQENTEILYISLEKGSDFPAHDSPKNAFLQVLEGEIIFRINNQVFTIKAQENFQFPPKEIHSVSAIQNSKFLIIR